MKSLVDVDKDKPNNRLNDGKVDPIGRLLAGQSAYLATFLLSFCMCYHGNSDVLQVQWGRKKCRTSKDLSTL